MDLGRSGVLFVGVALTVMACEGPSRITAPLGTAAASRGATTEHVIAEWKHGLIRLQVRDQCDPTTFNKAVGPGTCAVTPTVGRRVLFQDFVGQLQQNHNARGWFNTLGLVLAVPNSTIDALNTGGELHTFTRVAKYGGGLCLCSTACRTPRWKRPSAHRSLRRRFWLRGRRTTKRYRIRPVCTTTSAVSIPG